MRIFLDANIAFLAGYSSTSPVRYLLALARHGDCELVTSSYAFEEARRNLAVKGPSDGLDRLERAASLIALVGEAQPTALQAADQVQLGDPSDGPILAAAIQCRADVLVSRDRRAFGALFGSWVSHIAILMLRADLQRIFGED